MGQSVIQQFFVLFLSVGAGLVVGFFFDCYRAFRYLVRWGWLLTQVTDLLFAVFCSFFVFGLFFWSTGGEVRFYTSFFIPLGLWIYFWKLSPLLQRSLVWTFGQLGCFFKFCYLVLLYYPLSLGGRGVFLFFVVLAGLLRLFLLPLKTFASFSILKVREGWWMLRKKFSS